MGGEEFKCTPSANKSDKDLILVYTVQLKSMIENPSEEIDDEYCDNYNRKTIY